MQYNWCLYKDKKSGPRGRHEQREEHEQTEGESHVKTGVMLPQVRELTEARERPGTDPPWSLQRGHGPPRCWFQTMDLLNRETIHFCCCKPPGVWYFALAAPANEWIYTLIYLSVLTPSSTIWHWNSGRASCGLSLFLCFKNHPGCLWALSPGFFLGC